MAAAKSEKARQLKSIREAADRLGGEEGKKVDFKSRKKTRKKKGTRFWQA